MTVLKHLNLQIYRRDCPEQTHIFVLEVLGGVFPDALFLTKC